MAADERTIYRKVSECGGGGALDFDIRAFEEEEDGLESGTVDGAHIWERLVVRQRACIQSQPTTYLSP